MNNSFNYIGVVDVTDGISNVRIKNAGGEGVAELFTRATLGYPTANSRPSKLDIVLGTKDDLSEDQSISDLPSILFSKVSLKTSSFGIINDIGEYYGWKYPVLDILILADNINISDYANNGKECTVILYNDQDQVFSSIGITIIDPIDNESQEGDNTLYYHSGNNILIRWYMYITNSESGD